MTMQNAESSVRRAAGRRTVPWVKLLILGGAIAAFPLSAQPLRSEQVQPLWGVWKGSTGDAEVLLCVQADPDRSRYDDFAAIYTTVDYQIELLDRSDETGQTWGARRDETVTAFLSVLADGSVRLERDPEDAWSGVPLAPIPFSSGEDQTRPCESAAFNLPRAVLPTIERAADTVDGTRYEILTLVDPAGHGEVSTFQLPPGPAGFAVINDWLNQAIPETAEEAPYFTCTVEALANGAGSFWEQRFRPEMISDRFVVVAETADVFCGGPYPAQLTEWYVFDTKTGEELDTRSWLHPDAFNLLGPNAGAGSEIGDLDIAIGFRDLLTQVFLATDPHEDCLDLLDYVEVWNIRPSRAGFILSPEIAHVSQFCAEDLEINTKDLSRYSIAVARKYMK